ncbi:MAG: hypothetical protein JSV85_01105 [Candidatus Bathyarchaeota archaeon]|nr:MAG: hypothetical protein JSV85_01105 [Candidatus Bathyarchaeota archaeon]
MKLRLMGVVLSFLVFFLSPLPLFGSICTSPQEATSEVTVPWRSSAEADGFIKPGEYDDALELNLTRDNWMAYLYLKHDGESLYVFLDHVSDTTYWYDNCWLSVDTFSDGGETPKEDDYLFDCTHHVYIGDGPHQIPNGQWTTLIGHGEPYQDLVNKTQPFLEGRYRGSRQSGRSANSLNPHSIFEIKVPITGWEINETDWTFGFCVAAGSPRTEENPSAKAVWPRTAYDDYTADFYAGGANPADPKIVEPQIGSFPSPNTWSTITLSDVPPEEDGGKDYWFSLVAVTLGAAIIGTAILLVRRHTRSADSQS